MNLTVVFGFAQGPRLNCCVVIIVCDVDPPVLEAKRGLCRGHCSICEAPGPRPGMSPAPARRRSGTPVKHGCALEEGKMLNCVGISREKQQTWQDWVTILLSSDTIKRKPVSLDSSAALGRLCEGDVRVQAASQCVKMLMLHSCG